MDEPSNKNKFKVIVNDLVKGEKVPIDEYTKSFPTRAKAISYAFRMLRDAEQFSGLHPGEVLVEVLYEENVVWGRKVK